MTHRWGAAPRLSGSEHDHDGGGPARGRSARPVSRGEEGSATVLLLVLVGLLTTVAVAGAAVGGLLVGQRRAASAADLAALAAAEALGPVGTAAGGASACQEAGRVSEANRARLTDCLVEGQEVAVEVAVDVPGLLGGAWKVPGRARAGPADGPSAEAPTGAGGPGP